MEGTAWVYLKSEPNLYTVGFRDPVTGEWHPESDWETSDEAAKRVNYLNGGEELNRETIGVLENLIHDLERVAAPQLIARLRNLRDKHWRKSMARIKV